MSFVKAIFSTKMVMMRFGPEEAMFSSMAWWFMGITGDFVGFNGIFFGGYHGIFLWVWLNMGYTPQKGETSWGNSWWTSGFWDILLSDKPLFLAKWSTWSRATACIWVIYKDLTASWNHGSGKSSPLVALIQSKFQTKTTGHSIAGSSFLYGENPNTKICCRRKEKVVVWHGLRVWPVQFVMVFWQRRIFESHFAQLCCFTLVKLAMKIIGGTGTSRRSCEDQQNSWISKYLWCFFPEKPWILMILMPKTLKSPAYSTRRYGAYPSAWIILSSI